MGRTIGLDDKGQPQIEESSAAWYVIITNPQCERKATTELRRAGIRVYLPQQVIVRKPTVIRNARHPDLRQKRETRVHRPLWTGYVLCRFPAGVSEGGQPMFAVARSCNGVRDFLKWRNAAGDLEPIPFSERLVLAFMRRQRARDYDGAKLARDAREAKLARFARGADVRIHGGLFEGFLTKIEKRTGDQLEVSIDIFGRPTLVTVDVDDVTPVALQGKAA